jgi:hypothetical protein
VRAVPSVREKAEKIESLAQSLGLEADLTSRWYSRSQYLTVTMPTADTDEDFQCVVRVSDHDHPEGRGGYYRSEYEDGYHDIPHISFHPGGASLRHAAAILRELRDVAARSQAEDLAYHETRSAGQSLPPVLAEIRDRYYALAASATAKRIETVRRNRAEKIRAQAEEYERRRTEFGALDPTTVTPGCVIERFDPSHPDGCERIIVKSLWKSKKRKIYLFEDADGAVHRLCPAGRRVPGMRLATTEGARA